MCHHAGHLQPWALFMVLFRVHCSLGRSQNTCTAGQSSLFTESASEARSLIFHSCPPGCLWWPYKGKIPFRQRRAAQKKPTHWQSVWFLTSSFSKRKPPMFHFFSGYFFVPLSWLSYPAISRACMTQSFPLWLERKQSNFWKSMSLTLLTPGKSLSLGNRKLGCGSRCHCLTYREQWGESLPSGLCTLASWLCFPSEGSPVLRRLWDKKLRTDRCYIVPCHSWSSQEHRVRFWVLT